MAIEPESGDHFLADTLDDAVRASRTRHPTRLTHVIRVGQRAVFHFGAAGSWQTQPRLQAPVKLD